ncbi:MAG TPA: hypothetical protein VGO93_08415 [Candidatus Xenobia bacterium]|jgi:hypothetical protein
MTEKPIDETWSAALPEKIPRRTYTPAVVAAGLVLIFWGFITSPILTGAGIGLLGIGMAGWIEELQCERRK